MWSKIMCAAMIYTLIYPISLVVIHSSENRKPEINNFAVVFDGV